VPPAAILVHCRLYNYDRVAGSCRSYAGIPCCSSDISGFLEKNLGSNSRTVVINHDDCVDGAQGVVIRVSLFRSLTNEL